MICKQCNKGFTCGCQKTTANDGSVVHKSCLTGYQTKISGVSSKTDLLTENIKNAYSNITKK
jgi:hypothetical protein